MGGRLAPSNQLSYLISNSNNYNQLAEDLQLTFPALDTPEWLKWLNLISVLPVFVCCILLTRPFLFTDFVLSVALVFSWIKSLNYLDRKFRILVPQFTVREFVELVTALNFKRIDSGYASIDEVKILVRRKIAHVFDLDLNTVTGASRFGEYLGID